MRNRDHDFLLGVGLSAPAAHRHGRLYIFIGPIVAIAKDVSLRAAMTALMIGGLVHSRGAP